MIVTLALLAAYPLALLAALVCLVNVVILMIPRLHPLRVLMIALVNAALIGLIGLLSVLPSSLWWAAWILPLLTVVAVGFACWRLLARPPRADLSRCRARLLQRPHPVLIVLPVLFFVVVGVVPLVWG